jgi:hypothetical protein
MEYVLYKFPKYHTKILLGDFSVKIGREEIFKTTTGNESSHEISNDGVRAVNLATSKNLTVKSMSHIATFITVTGRLQMGNPKITLTIF